MTAFVVPDPPALIHCFGFLLPTFDHLSLPTVHIKMAAGLKSRLLLFHGVAECCNMDPGYAAVILLAFVLAVGFLLIILSCALWNNWLPLLVGMSN